ncbi:MAG TPA: acyl-CoA dehydrogenase family protein [Acidimicrobiales bacterium]|nr:acyl-CoA dehydrogenase family protein [Acidimicrobiales bacterium]
MDFSLDEEQEAVRELAARILGDLSTPERLKELEASDDRIDRKAWQELANAGLLGIALPESDGGADLGFAATAVVAEEVGRAAAAVPYVAVAVTGAGPIAALGTDAQKARWLAGILAGDTIAVGALVEAGGDPALPSTTATRDDGSWRLNGTKTCVPAGMAADLLVVSARTDDGAVGLFVVPTSAPGVTRLRQEATSGALEAEVELAGVVVDDGDVLVAGDAGADALVAVLEQATTAVCLEVAGACQAAVKLTAAYTSEREQFGKPIATFQAVGQRAADAFIDSEAVRLTAWQAAWRLAEGLPAAAEVAVAKYWADDGAQRCVLAAQHLHGGVGVDREYPLHRYFLRVKHLSLTLGGATTSLLRLGDLLAEEPV